MRLHDRLYGCWLHDRLRHGSRLYHWLYGLWRLYCRLSHRLYRWLYGLAALDYAASAFASAFTTQQALDTCGLRRRLERLRGRSF